MCFENRVGRHLHIIFESLPNPFAQLVFLESLRDRYSRIYVHDAWASVSSPAEVHAALHGIHLRIFQSVAGLSLIDLSRKLRAHFQAVARPERRTAQLWLETKPYQEMIPDGCSPLLRAFFVSQIRCALDVLIRDPDWAPLGEAGPPEESIPDFLPQVSISPSDWLN